MPIYEYECPICNKRFERFTHKKVSHATCDCGSRASKVMSLTKVGNGSAFRNKWHPEEMNAQKDIEHWQKKNNKNFFEV